MGQQSLFVSTVGRNVKKMKCYIRRPPLVWNLWTCDYYYCKLLKKCKECCDKIAAIHPIGGKKWLTNCGLGGY